MRDNSTGLVMISGECVAGPGGAGGVFGGCGACGWACVARGCLGPWRECASGKGPRGRLWNRPARQGGPGKGAVCCGCTLHWHMAMAHGRGHSVPALALRSCPGPGRGTPPSPDSYGTSSLRHAEFEVFRKRAWAGEQLSARPAGSSRLSRVLAAGTGHFEFRKCMHVAMVM